MRWEVKRVFTQVGDSEHGPLNVYLRVGWEPYAAIPITVDNQFRGVEHYLRRVTEDETAASPVDD